MKKLYVSLLAGFFFFGSQAQFLQGYAPAKWTTALSAGSNGSVNTASAPGSIVLTGSNDPSESPSAGPVDVDFTIRALAAGTWSFHWVYVTNDSDHDPQWDVAGVLLNGSFVQLTSNTGGVSQSGTYTGTVAAGDVIGFRVRAVDNILGNATFSLSSFSPPGGVLPVKLSSFTASKVPAGVLLQWFSETEVNTSHYSVERSADGRSFAPLGKVAAGTPWQPYAFTDPQPVAGINYYRLQMVDRDGQSSYSKVVTVAFSGATGMAAYPNPARSVVVLRLNAVQPATEQLLLYTASGSLLHRFAVPVSPGVNQKEINVSLLPRGLYFFKTGSGLVQSFVKE